MSSDSLSLGDILQIAVRILLIGVCLAVSAVMLVLFIMGLTGMSNYDWTMFIALLALTISIIALVGR